MALPEKTFYGRSAASQNRFPVPGEGAANEDDDFVDMRLPMPTTKYREATLGKLLIESLNELIEAKKISPGLYTKILCQYDRTMLNAMSSRASARMTFKSSKLRSYRFLDGVWSFTLDHVEFREFHSFANVDNLLIHAFDGRVPVPRPRAKRWRQGQGPAKQ